MCKKYFFLLLFSTVLILNSAVYSQRILFQSDFENINFTNSDSLPSGWKKLDADSNFFGIGKSWAVRDTNQILGGDTIVNRPHSHSGKKSLHISWLAGKGGSYESDDWVWTDSLRIQTGDSLIFWTLLGNIPGISFYTDSLQIYVCAAQSVSAGNLHLITLRSYSDTTTNVWTEQKFDLSQFAGQKIYIAFRYYLPVQEALWCNIDDMIIGNRSGSIGIYNISSVTPKGFILYQNYPNPFNPVTKINYELPASRQGGRITNYVSLKVYDVLGSEVATLVNEKQTAGIYEVTFDGSETASGIYYYTLSVGDFKETKRMVLVK